MRRLLASIILGLIFFIFGIVTLPKYGINWDTINHLPRGAAYLHFFLTGKKDYSDLPRFVNYFQNPHNLFSNTTQSRSYYQTNAADFGWFMQYDGHGHPPLSDILSAFFNLILFSKLHVVNDIDAYHVYGIFLAACLVGLIYYWVSKYYGKVAGVVASMSLAMYPLFWSESHFNTEKDVPETVFWSFFIFCIWKGVTEKRIKWILVSGLLFGLALGTKFNILFSFFVVIPWIIAYLFVKREKLVSIVNFKILIAGSLAIFIGIGIFFAAWPYLWPDPLGRVQGVINFYKGIGVATGAFDARFVGPFGLNMYPFIWIITTTSPVILFLALVGVFFVVKNLRRNNCVSLIFLLWFFIPVARVTWHGADIYGGIRQIMEYVPALAVFSGIGSGILARKLITYKMKIVFVFVTFIFLLIPILETRPNENVYFNFLIGGLAGAKAANIPSWGNSFGSPFRQAAAWLDMNAEKDANISFARELLPNMPGIWLRPDLNLTNGNRSGPLHEGEYVVGLVYQGVDNTSYFDRYLEKFLVPVYSIDVDGVSILEIWKNDLIHTKSIYQKDQLLVSFKLTTSTPGEIEIDFGQIIKLSSINAILKNKNCSNLETGYVEISEDGNKWLRLPGQMPKEDWSVPKLGNQPGKDGTVLIPFAADPVRFLRLNYSPSNSCLNSLTNIVVKYF